MHYNENIENYTNKKNIIRLSDKYKKLLIRK